MSDPPRPGPPPLALRNIYGFNKGTDGKMMNGDSKTEVAMGATEVAGTIFGGTVLEFQLKDDPVQSFFGTYTKKK